MKTKVYGTVGPACCDTDTLVRLFEKGMTGVRINLSHSNLCDAKEWILNIRKAFDRYTEKRKEESTVKIQAVRPELLMDLKGPELRIGKLMTDRSLKESDRLTLMPEGWNHLFDPTEIPAPAFVISDLKKGQELSLDDGKILLCVEELFPVGMGVGNGETERQNAAECRVMRGGVLKSGKSIALPGVEVTPPTLTESDRENIAVAKEYGVTGVMLPFVRSREDLLNLKRELESAGAADIRVFAKIENERGVERLPELMEACDEIVIARGDLGNAVPLWELPVLQRQIAEQCKQAEMPFMVVTQMLASMEQYAVPTRAEVSDIFRAVEEGAASVMLTGETAAGDYPVEAMDYMVKTVCAAERYQAGLSALEPSACPAGQHQTVRGDRETDFVCADGSLKTL